LALTITIPICLRIDETGFQSFGGIIDLVPPVDKSDIISIGPDKDGTTVITLPNGETQMDSLIIGRGEVDGILPRGIMMKTEHAADWPCLFKSFFIPYMGGEVLLFPQKSYLEQDSIAQQWS